MDLPLVLVTEAEIRAVIREAMGRQVVGVQRRVMAGEWPEDRVICS
jgi:hypothetical protein